MQRSEDQISSLHSDYLQYGSEITLSYQNSGYISSSGFIENLLYLKASGEYLDLSESLFRILPFTMHSVQSSLLSEISTSSSNPIEKLTRDNNPKMYQSKMGFLDSEIRSNLLNYEKTRGQFIRFGSLVYLQHVASHKFLTVFPKETGVIEKYSVKVALTDFPNDLSYIRIEPSYNFQREGEGFIRTNDVVKLVIFSIDLNMPAYINSSKEKIEDSPDYSLISDSKDSRDSKEINASLDTKMKWRINLFSFSPKDKQKLLLYGDCIWISHSEGGVVLSTVKNEERYKIEFNSNLNDCNGLWRVEHHSMVGGYVYTDQKFYLRHINSGLYLHCNNINEKITGELGEFSKNCLWKFKSIYNWEKHAKVQIDQFFYLTNVETHKNLHGVEGKNKEFVKVGFGNESEAAYFRIFKADATFIWETQFSVSCFKIIHEFGNYIKEENQKKDGFDLKWTNKFKGHTDSIINCLDQMGKFLQHKLPSSLSTGKNFGQVDSIRQKIFKEIYIIDILSYLLKNLFVNEFNLTKLYNNHSKIHGLEGNSDIFIPFALKNVALKIYEVLTLTCSGNAVNQIYAFKYFPFYQMHGGYGLGATNCMKSILINNEVLVACLEEGSLAVQLSQRGVSVIEHYVWLLRKFFKERKHYVVEFLSEICGFHDVGVAINQNSIHSKLFLNPTTYNKGIILTNIDTDSKSLNLILNDPQGGGETIVSLSSCFKDNKILVSYQSEINYFIELLKLYANLSKGRNEACKESIVKWFPIEVLIEYIWKKNLCPEIHAAFLMMIMNIHIDSQPRVSVRKPELIRSFRPGSYTAMHRYQQRHSIRCTNAKLAKPTIRPQTMKKLVSVESDHFDIFAEDSFKDEDQYVHDNDDFPLAAFKEKLISELISISIGNPVFDIWLLQLLKCANMLVKFEIISIDTTDKDVGLSLSSNPTGYSIDHIKALLEAANSILFENVSFRTDTVNATNSPDNIQAISDQMDKIKKLKTNADDPFRRFSEGITHYIKNNFMKNDEDLNRESEEIKCKLELCDLLFRGIDLRQDFLISNFIKWFIKSNTSAYKRFTTKFTDEEFNDDIESIGNINSLFPPLIGSISTQSDKFIAHTTPEIHHLTDINPKIFKDLFKLFMKSKNYKLQTKAIHIILRLFTQRRELIKNLKKVNFMVYPNDADVYVEAKLYLSAIKNYSDQASVICNYWKQEEIYKNFSNISIEKLINALESVKGIMLNDENPHEIRISDQADEKFVSQSRQGMMRYLYLHTYIIKFISQGFPVLEDVDDDLNIKDRDEVLDTLKEVFSLCFEVLEVFVKNNIKNKHLVFESLETISKTLHFNLGQISLICEIFHNCPDLCNKINENLIKTFEVLMNLDKNDINPFKFFKTIITPKSLSNPARFSLADQKSNKVPIPHLQRLILSIFTSNETLDYFPSKTKENYNLATKSSPKHSKLQSILITILGKCGIPNKGFKLNMIQVRKTFPIVDLCNLLKNNQIDHESLHKPLIKLLKIIYVNKDSVLELFDCEAFQYLAKDYILFVDKNIESRKIKVKCLNHFIEILEESIQLIENYFRGYDYRIMQIILGELRSDTEDLILGEVNPIIIQSGREHPDFNQVKRKSIQANNQGQIDEIYSEANFKNSWDCIIESLSTSDYSKMIKEERTCFLNMFTDLHLDEDLQAVIIFQSLFEYISLSLIHKPPTKILCSVVEFLGYHLVKPLANQENETSINKSRQNEYQQMNVVPIIMNIMCDPSIHTDVLSVLIEFSIKLLDGGNEKIQQDFYDYFIVKPSSENFFAALYTRISDFTVKIAVIADSDSMDSKYFKKSRKELRNIIKLMQLFCENHFETLQNYLRKQEKSRNNFDLIEAVVLLLRELMVKKRLQFFHVMSHCFELLTECTQGPCLMNQKAIINSKFLETASELLSIDENSEEIVSFDGLNSVCIESANGCQNLLKGWMISHLKYKCLITLIALLEGQNSKDTLIRLFRSLNLLIFKKNLSNIYKLYKLYYTNKEYSNKIFSHFKTNKNYKLSKNENQNQDSDPKYFLTIIETGFMIYELVSHFSEINDPDIHRIIRNDFPELFLEMPSSFFNFLPLKLFEQKVKFVYKVIESRLNPENDPAQDLKEAMKFFKSKIRSIEVVFKTKIIKMYFWLPPVCEYLTVEAKKKFHKKADRSSEKSKIEYLVNKFPIFLDDMQHEESLSSLIGYRFISPKIALIKILLFLLTLYLNFLLLMSYHDYDGERLDKPEFGYIKINSDSKYIVGYEKTINHIIAVGIVHCIFSCLIFIYFIVKKVPLIIKTQIREMQSKIQLSEFKKFRKIFSQLIMKVDVIYQFGFFIFSIMGLVWHPFFFSVHLLDILYRIPSLQSVIMAVVLPWRSLILIFFLVIIINYLFSIWAYVDYYEQFGGNCDSLILCFRTIFDQGYKNSGGIGMWLDYIVIYDLPDPTITVIDPRPEFHKNDIISRYFFDDIYMIIIPILIANVIYGLILDTFSVLNKTDDESRADRENKCFICGKERSDIERLTSKPFKYHIETEHCEWNYIFFMAYLEYKDETEYSGIESYIKDHIKRGEVDWIPQQQGLSFSDEQKENINHRLEEFNEIKADLDCIGQDIKNIKYEKRQLKISANRRL